MSTRQSSGCKPSAGGHQLSDNESEGEPSDEIRRSSCDPKANCQIHKSLVFSPPNQTVTVVDDRDYQRNPSRNCLTATFKPPTVSPNWCLSGAMQQVLQ